jgi:hypothetical protein
LIGVFSITTEKENELIAELLQRTAAGKLRWGFQPPSTLQTNLNQLHYVLRLRRDIYRLTARRDGGKTEKFIIERKATEDSVLSQLYRLARA